MDYCVCEYICVYIHIYTWVHTCKHLVDSRCKGPYNSVAYYRFLSCSLRTPGANSLRLHHLQSDRAKVFAPADVYTPEQRLISLNILTQQLCCASQKSYIRTCMHTTMHKYIHTNIQRCIHVCIYVCIMTPLRNNTWCVSYIHTCMHTTMHKYIHANTKVYTRMYICMSYDASQKQYMAHPRNNSVTSKC